jgi:hypothetical protein
VQILITPVVLYNRFLDDAISREPAGKQTAENEANDCRFTIHAADDSGNSAATREKPCRKKHGIAQLGCNFVITGWAISSWSS